MKPETKANTVFSYLALIFIGILVITLVLLAYLENKNEEIVVENPVAQQTPKVNTLTDEEFKKELNELSGIASKPTSVVEYDITNDANTSLPENGDAQSTANNSNSVGNETKLTTTEKRSAFIDPVFTNTEENSVYEQESSQILNYKGTIYKTENNLLIISVSGGFAKAQIKDTTKITINGKSSNFSSLQVAQNVEVEGFGNEKTKELIAESVIVTGEVQVIPF